jgi:hypothetical protein
MKYERKDEELKKRTIYSHFPFILFLSHHFPLSALNFELTAESAAELTVDHQQKQSPSFFPLRSSHTYLV